ncbi:MAG: arginine--tRNA ligase [Candidatus Parcubacteria bacterium]|nr:MAG: arginine--tRNA ligase [Candidatus Parcubacteria bacterium]
MNSQLLKKKIINILKEEIPEEALNEIKPKLKVFVQFDNNFGDYSTNLLFLLQNLSPQQRNTIYQKLTKKLSFYFEKIEIVNNYINFYLNNAILVKFFKQIQKKQKFIIKQNDWRRQRVNIDYVSANPTGPLTLGNARGAVIGDVLKNVFNLLGAKTTTEYYVNDRGKQIDILGKTVLAYLNNQTITEEMYQGSYVKEIALMLKNKIKQQDNIQAIGKKAAELILEKLIKKSLNKFNTQHNYFFYESDLYAKNIDKKVLKIFQQKKLLFKHDGALFLNLKKLGETKDEVLIKSDGEPTYFFSDILHYYYKFFYLKNKIEILIVSSDHLDHCRRLKTALKIFNIKNQQFQPLIYQMVHLKIDNKNIKMSKRAGTFITIDDLLQTITADVLRFFFLQKSPDTTLELDLELMKKQTIDNPYWYLQYSYVRLLSIIKKAKKIKKTTPSSKDMYKLAYKAIMNDNAKDILKTLYKFPDLLNMIAKDKKTNIITDYLLNIAKKIHLFYESEKIIENNNQVKQHLLVFIKSVINFYHLLFAILQISPRQKM